MNWPLFFKNRRNKIFAIAFAALALCFFITYVVLYYIGIGGPGGISFNSVLRIISFMIQFGIIAYLLVTNINNDSRAYQAIMMWIFWYLIDEVFTLIASPSVFSVFRSAVTPAVAIFAVSQPILAAACLVLSIVLYVLVRRYMFGGGARFSTIRMLAILYAGLSLLSYAMQIGLVVALGSPVALSDIFGISSKFCADIAVIFTLERLRR